MLCSKNKSIFILLTLLEAAAILAITSLEDRYTILALAWISIAQFLYNVILLKVTVKLPCFSLPVYFAFFTLLFHCGQIIKVGFNINGDMPLAFENYSGGPEVVYKSFMFYTITQLVFTIAVGTFIASKESKRIIPKKWISSKKTPIKLYSNTLLIIGAIPRFYIDIKTLLGALIDGYHGVYTLYFPQALQSLAFFFDAGLFFALFRYANSKKSKILFWIVILYKCIVMATGARQDKVAFILLWVYVYFFIINKIEIKKMIMLIAGSILGLVFISAIGTIRSGDSSSIQEAVRLMRSGDMTNVFGGILGEFGSAFDTLEVAVRYTPTSIEFGYGRSYIAGILSIVPLLVRSIPSLNKTVIFVHQLPANVYFALGGSYLGELFYNFAWLGVLGSFILGWFIAKLHNGITDKNNASPTYKAWCAVLATSLLLFVRGYFTDMVQKLVWVYVIICIIDLFYRSYMRKME